MTAGLSSASFCWIASAVRNSASASAGLPVSQQQDADSVDRVRQVAAGVVRGPGGGGQRLLVGPRQPVGRQRVGGLARARAGASPAATGRPPAPPAPPGRNPPGPPAATPTGGRSPAPRPSSPSLRAAQATAVRLRPTSTFVAGVGPRLGRQRLPRRQHRPVRRQRVLLAADLAGQLGQLEVRLRQRPPRGEVGLLAEQGAELAVEVRGRFQEPVAQLLELVLLEQEVLADAGVERLDRLDGQVVAGLHRGLRAASSEAAGRLASRARQRPGDSALARVCTASTADSPTTPASTRHRRAGHRRPVPRRPAHERAATSGSRQAETGSSAIHRSRSSARARRVG